MDDNTTQPEDEQRPVSRIDLLFIMRAYNRKEISYEEWLRLSREWVQAVMEQYGTSGQKRSTDSSTNDRMAQ